MLTDTFSFSTTNMYNKESALLRRKKDVKKGTKFTFMVCGAMGTGKSTFINSLVHQHLVPKRFEHNASDSLPKTLSFFNIEGAAVDASSARASFDPESVHLEPGIAITEYNIELVDGSDSSKLMLTILDTPGFGDNFDNEVCFQEISNYVENQFDSVLAEETRIRRNPRFEDTRIHACLYFITPTGHGLRELDVETMKRLSKYLNVIPIIGRADSFTPSELKLFKQRIVSDIARYNIPVYQFTYDEDEDDEETIKENKFLASIQPFAVVASEEDVIIDGVTTKGRNYPWGSVDIYNPAVSDFALLKSVLLGSHLQDLKDLTHDFLYEMYRTERLTSVTSENSGIPSTRTREPPSLSNLAAITASQSITPNNENDKILHESLKSSESIVQPVDSISDKSASTVATPTSKQSSVFRKSVSPSKYDGASIASSPTIPQQQRSQLRILSETVPYVLKHERLASRQQKLQELENRSAKELSLRAAALEKKATELKLREKMLLKQLEQGKQLDGNASEVDSVHIKKEETLTNLHSIVSNSTEDGQK
ncbi:BA75_03525T0 [Komagataella pastoris]|uniref:BA75_03525T0 n=1 Tax=Komagataella pastoris TaxID=4922 RepID=A0A1B2JF08_PICPA|nr:BA75_03525T0 [Komagataella pastoris]